jgi:hypothetical protein
MGGDDAYRPNRHLVRGGVAHGGPPLVVNLRRGDVIVIEEVLDGVLFFSPRLPLVVDAGSSAPRLREESMEEIAHSEQLSTRSFAPASGQQPRKPYEEYRKASSVQRKSAGARHQA